MGHRILILGGTTEARRLGEHLATRSDLAVTISLAGRTASQSAQAVPVRVGGFGGVAGLTQYLRENAIDALVDATHPYAPTISAHAWKATVDANIPMIVLRRPPWQPHPGDRWTEVLDANEAALALGPSPKSVFLTLGRQEIGHFASAPQHRYLIRSVDPVDPPLAVPYARYLLARGPFEEGEERALLRDHAIDALVAKNSGGTATYGKIAAARALGIEVVLLRRPPEPPGPAVTTIAEVIAWLDHVLVSPADRGV